MSKKEFVTPRMPLLKLTGDPAKDAETLYRAMNMADVTEVSLSSQSGVPHLPSRNTIRLLKQGQSRNLLQVLALLHRLGYRWIIPVKPTEGEAEQTAPPTTE